MSVAVPFACFLSLIRPPGIQFENSLLQILPVDKSKCPFVRDHTDISFQLFTRHNPTVYEELRIGDDEKLFASSIDLNDQTVFYFHAFMEQPDDGSGIMIREAYMQRGDTNVIMIDAHQLEAGPWYFTAAQNTWYIGNFAARFIDYLVSRGLDLQKTHLVGHSLGAQSAGVAGAALKTGRVSRITGLDPALPLFDGLSLAQRLDSSDADFVDVIHTDAGIFGVKEPLGHIDFYPNGGQSPQPGCELKAVIPEQMFLNTCDGFSQIQSYYTFSLQPKTGLNTRTKLNALKNHKQKNDYIKNNRACDSENDSIRDIVATDTLPNYGIDTLKLYETMKLNTDVKSSNKMLRHKTAFSKNIARQTFTVALEPTNLNKRVIQDYINSLNRDSLQQKTTDAVDKEISNMFIANAGLQLQSKLSGRLTELNTNKVNVDDSSFDLEESISDRSNKHSQDFNNFIKTNEIIPRDKLQVEFNIPTDGIAAYIDDNSQEIIQKFNRYTVIAKNDLSKDVATHSPIKLHVVKRDRRSLSLFNTDENLLLRLLNFLTRNRKSILPVLTVMREISTLARTGNGELSQFIKERNNYIGVIPPLSPVSYNFELGSDESKLKAFLRKLLGLRSNGDSFTIEGFGR